MGVNVECRGVIVIDFETAKETFVSAVFVNMSEGAVHSKAAEHSHCDWVFARAAAFIQCADGCFETSNASFPSSVIGDAELEIL